MTYHVDFELRAGGRGSVAFTAPSEVAVQLTRDGATVATFSSTGGADAALAVGRYRVTAGYRTAPQAAWIPMDVDVVEDTASRGVFRASAYVATATGTTKLEAILTVAKA